MSGYLKKRIGAVTVLVLLITLSTLMSAHRALTDRRSDIEAMLVTGVDGGGVGIYSDIDKRADYARNLVKVASKYAGLTDQCQAVTAACDALSNRTGGAAEAYDLNKALTDAAETLYLAMTDLSDQDEKYRQDLYVSFLSRNDTITNEAARYNKLALEFNNSVLGAFPANFLKIPAFVKDCELFS